MIRNLQLPRGYRKRRKKRPRKKLAGSMKKRPKKESEPVGIRNWLTEKTVQLRFIKISPNSEELNSQPIQGTTEKRS